MSSLKDLIWDQETLGSRLSLSNSKKTVCNTGNKPSSGSGSGSGSGSDSDGRTGSGSNSETNSENEKKKKSKKNSNDESKSNSESSTYSSTNDDDSNSEESDQKKNGECTARATLNLQNFKKEIRIPTKVENICSEIYLGVTLQNSVGDGQQNGWVYDLWSGDIISPSEGSKWTEYGEECAQGDIITLIIDPQKKTISFEKNKKNFGVAFHKIPENINLILDIWKKGDQITLL
ncbi:heterogeneous nuclear ribonucleoprotein u family member [Anaeramoeba flamelloides]|uniref:Heterogeneous nuclear ribonucleoprotein u family member n=1 Tax=Anaeramoeba flamelloides TaxID=1746091 RepID=A0AAV7ZGZ7_9EUKA|nr:heterogeneous nuclear ribonucleoprotein u family member [Anaeramoeba flamelloides]